MKYTIRESLTGSGNWFIETTPGCATVALVRSETLARQIATMLESGALRESLHVPQTPDTALARSSASSQELRQRKRCRNN